MYELKPREMDSTSVVVFAATSVFMVSLTLGSPWLLWEMPLFCGASYTDIRIEKKCTQDRSFLSLLTEV